MNYQNTSHSAQSQNRRFNAPAFQPRPARFTVEDESEGVELFLRGLLILSLVVHLTICNAYLAAGGRVQPNVLPSHDTAVAVVQSAVATVAAAL